jgi:AcrR family transcriptional regulator
MGRPREHGPETRERLLDVAGRILADEGAAALSARRLATEVDVSTRAIYSLFDGMPAVLAALYRRGFEHLLDACERTPRQDDAVAETRVLADVYRQVALANPELYLLMFQRPVPTFRPSDEDFAFAVRGFDRLRDAVERAISQRRLRGRDVGRTTYQLWAVVHGLTSLELTGFLDSRDELDAAWQDTIGRVIDGFFQPRG